MKHYLKAKDGMVDYYRINVTLNGKYLFATEQGGITYREDAEKVTALFKEKFPENEGYKISVTKWEGRGKPVEF